MFYQFLDFLLAKKYGDIVQWAHTIRKNYKDKLNPDRLQIFDYIIAGDLDALINFFEKKTYTYINNETFALILQELTQNRKNIQEQWRYIDQFHPNDEFANLILNDQILALKLQDGGKISKDEDITTISREINKYIEDPNKLWIGGKIYSTVGINSIYNLKNSLKISNIKERMQSYYKYEKIAQFIESLDIPLQKLFSIHRLGVIIYQNEIYLIKWIQYFDQDQILDEKNPSKKEITVLEDFGVKIGVELKENLELGNLVIFRNSEEDSSGTNKLEPLISINSEILNQNQPSKEINYDLNKKEDCLRFIDDVNARIESGILLLTKKRETLMQDSQDLDTYVKITLERIKALQSINQRLNVLKDLLNLNKNPELKIRIIEELEKNYLIFIKTHFSAGNTSLIPQTIKTLADLGLFKENISILIHTLVFLFQNHYTESSDILRTVDLLNQRWEISNDLMILLEKPQVIALSNEVIQMVKSNQISTILPFLKHYLTEHPRFHSYNILSLILRILQDIYKPRHQSKGFNFENGDFISFFGEFLKILEDYQEKLSDDDYANLKQDIWDTVKFLSLDLDFIGFLNEKLIVFLNIIRNMQKDYINKIQYYQIVRNFTNHIPLVMFYSKKHQLGLQAFLFLTDSYPQAELFSQFMEKYIALFAKSKEKFQMDQKFFKQAVNLINRFKKYIDNNQIEDKKIIIPIRHAISKLLNNWYMSGDLPQQDFEVHRQLIRSWIYFANMGEKLEQMLNLLTIKDLVWTAQELNLSKFSEKYQHLSNHIFENYHFKLINEFIKLFEQKHYTFKDFQIKLEVFHIIKEDIERLHLNPTKFTHIIELFEEYVNEFLIHTIRQADVFHFSKSINILINDILLFSSQFLEEIIWNLTHIQDKSIKEGSKFIKRFSLLQKTFEILKKINSDYSFYFDRSRSYQKSTGKIITKSRLKQFFEDKSDAFLEIFHSAQEWLIDISIREYITTEDVIKPISRLFNVILTAFHSEQQPIKQELKDLSEKFFTNQRMLNSNKKYYFSMMKELLPDRKFPDFYPMLDEYSAFIDELSDIESLYFSLRDGKLSKAKIVNRRSKELIDRYPHLFSPWYFYANSLIIMENYREAVAAFQQALKYESSQSNYSRLYYNLIVAYLAQHKITEAVELVKNLPIGIKTFPYIKEIIQDVEDLSGEQLFEVQ